MIFGRSITTIAAVVAVAIDLAISFGLGLTRDQVILLNALVIGVLALVANQTMTPTSSPTLPAGTPVTITDPKDGAALGRIVLDPPVGSALR